MPTLDRRITLKIATAGATDALGNPAYTETTKTAWATLEKIDNLRVVVQGNQERNAYERIYIMRHDSDVSLASPGRVKVVDTTFGEHAVPVDRVEEHGGRGRFLRLTCSIK